TQQHGRAHQARRRALRDRAAERPPHAGRQRQGQRGERPGMNIDGSRADPGDRTDGPARCIGILTTDAQLVITGWDAALASMTGIASADAAGRRLSDVVPSLESRGLLAMLTTTLETGSARVLAPALHGYLIPCSPCTPSARFDRMQQRVVVAALQEDDRPVGLIVTVEDVTERLDR